MCTRKKNVALVIYSSSKELETALSDEKWRREKTTIDREGQENKMVM